ncbi:MAG: hypothetical protein QME55_12165 [Brevundimonas sp.]|nr:hypothetical protein [Brevundimonas sp.]
MKIAARAVAGLLAVSLAAPALASGQSALPEASGPTIEYETVAAAREALRSKGGVGFTIVNGWEVATDEAALTIWSFSPSDYPAYPAVVKRQVVEEGGQVSITMSIHCEASKSACDELARTFARMNDFELPQ